MNELNAKKEEMYRLIKTAGMLLYIPLIMVTGPFGGWVLGDIAEKYFHFSHGIMVMVMLSSLASIFEVARVIKMMAKVDR